ncbi:hypothetical protein SCHPADRAFT_825462, partial [Schizopora paradoxa]
YPFLNSDDFSVGAWLSESGASMATIDRFLKLPFVTKQNRLSFRTAQELYTKIALLPQPPKWLSRTVVVPGGTSLEPLTLFYRNGLEVFKFLLANPVFSGKQNFVPQKCFDEGDVVFFDEPTTAQHMWEVQVKFTSHFLI